MRVSLFDLVNWSGGADPADYDAAQARDLYAARLDEWQRAEQLGFDGVYLAEHHFGSGCLTPSPNILVAALSQRTTRMRIGVMVNVMPFHDPVRIAEEAAMLDLLSGGRLDFGVGRGVVQGEFVRQRMPYEEARPRMEEAMELVIRCWTQEQFEFHGKFRSVGPATMWPRPLQRPHPPIWCAAFSDDTVMWAARRGLSIGCTLLPVAGMRSRLELYRKTAAEAGIKVTPAQTLITRQVFVAESDGEARAISEQPFNDLFRFFIPPGEKREPSKLAADQKYYSEFYRGFVGRNLSFGDLIEAGLFVVGSPATVTRMLTAQLSATGAGHLLAWMNFGGLEAGMVRRSEELFASQVLPHLRAVG
ncbi:MAG TPA: LLM class flavin-dependent oxidoreductase [Candidatus Binataceae bacterium]|nr:LLM class flavin-dependent oxidoreductase [Candidatus Binataceae bacterium]